MKIRHVNAVGVKGAVIHDVLDESQYFYIVNSRVEEGRQIALAKRYWEPVPEKCWRDVTAECEVSHENGRLYHRGKLFPVVFGQDGYRLSKIVVLDESHRDAFIIEKEEP